MGEDAKRFAGRVIAAAEAQGWRVVKGGKHWKLYASDGRTIEIIATTPRTASGVEASIRRMQRAGFLWPSPK
jgi:hypothetical protein